LNPIEMLADDLDLSVIELKILAKRAVDDTCSATTASEAQKQFMGAEEEEQYFALMRWIELENTLEGIKKAYSYAVDYYLSTLAEKAVEKWNSIADKLAAATETKIGLLNLYEKVLSGSSAQRIIIEKLFALYEKEEAVPAE